jgi:protocatechuate 3,4-dioxygenase beta subunit
LSGALVEVWRADAERMDNPRPDVIFRGQFRTNTDGRYEFTTMRPVRHDTPYLNIRVSYQDHCPLVIQLRIATIPQPNKVLTKTVAAPSFHSTKSLSVQKNVTGPVLHGPVDIILPVPPPEY